MALATSASSIGQSGIVFAAAAEAAAGQHGFDLDILRLDAEYAGNRHVIHRLELAAKACFGLLAIPEHDAIERLHGRVGQIGKHIFRLDDALRSGKRARHVAMLGSQCAGGLREFAVVFENIFAAALLAARLVPFHLEGFAPFERRPGSIRVDGNALRDRLHVDDALDRQSIGGVETLHLGAEERWMEDRNGQHAGFGNVDGIFRRAVRFRRAVEPPHGTAVIADQAELRWILQCHFFRIGRDKCGRGGCEFAEAALLAGRGMTDHAAIDGDLACHHAPGLRGRLHQHGARHRARLSHLLV